MEEINCTFNLPDERKTKHPDGLVVDQTFRDPNAAPKAKPEPRRRADLSIGTDRSMEGIDMTFRMPGAKTPPETIDCSFSPDETPAPSKPAPTAKTRK